MKFKKVEISAFRIYNNPEDATFNLETESGIPADFVSIFAPNGFGKTSFYDAIEWCVTNDIQRFWQNTDITNEAIAALRDINAEKQLKLLRNRDAADNVETYVKIETDGPEFPIRKFYVHGNSGSDIKSMGEPEHQEFQRVILSQEWISAFLKESKGDKRYEKFMEAPQLKGLDEYYRKVKSLYLTCQKSIGELETLITEKKKQITDLGDDHFLDTVNNTIFGLVQRGESLELVTLRYTSKDVLDFTDKVSSRILSLNQRVTKAKDLIRSVEVAKTGNESVIGIENYYTQLDNFNSIVKELERITQLLVDFNALEKVSNDILAKVLQQDKLLVTQRELESLIRIHPEAERRHLSITESNLQIENKQKELNTLSKQLTEKRNNESNLLFKKEETSKEIEKLKNMQDELPGLKIRQGTLQTTLANLTNEKNTIQEKLEVARVDKGNAEDYLDTYASFVNLISELNFSVSAPKDLINADEMLPQLLRLQESRKEIDEAINSLEVKLNDQQNFNSSLTDLIGQGLKIINSTKTSSCPLCTKEYESYDELVKQITGNELLEKQIQTLIKDKSDLQDALQENENKITTESNSLLEKAKTNIAQKQTLLDGLTVSITNLTDQLLSIERSRENTLNDLSSITLQMDNLDIDLYDERLKLRMELLRTTNGTDTETIEVIKGEIATLTNQINNLTGEIDIAKETLESNSNHPEYIQLSDWFKKQATQNFGSVSLINNSLSDLAKNITAQADLLNELRSKQDDLQNKTSQYNRTSLVADKEGKEEANMKSSMVIAAYETFLSTQLGIQLEGRSKETTAFLLDEKSDSLQKDIQSLTGLVDDYSRLIEYCKNLMPFLQSEEAKAEVKAAEEQLILLVDTISKRVESEKNRTKDFLEKRVKDFFYTDLIDILYNKIDPHPDFKGVEFKADFESETPRLDILVTNNLNQQKLIPNLYFSTAQINILSLSIFLATALNTTEYNCIFIDDPIQSMDSINVLSTIDLLRGIVATGKKQIILSTHDENFFNLLKKKIPPDLFKSKFIELETFGKVKS